MIPTGNLPEREPDTLAPAASTATAAASASPRKSASASARVAASAIAAGARRASVAIGTLVAHALRAFHATGAISFKTSHRRTIHLSGT